MYTFTPEQDAAFQDLLATTEYVDASPSDDTDPDNSLAALAERLSGLRPTDPGFEEGVREAIEAVGESAPDVKAALEVLLDVDWSLTAEDTDFMRAKKIARIGRVAWAVGAKAAFAIADASWVDQLRVPKGNGDLSGRWTYTPWMHLDDLLSSLEGIERGPNEDAAIDEVMPALQAAEDALNSVDRDGFDPRDPAVAAAAARAATALDEAKTTLGNRLPDFGDRLDEASEAIRQFAEMDWSLMEEASDIGRDDSTAGDGAGRKANPGLWVWNEPLPSDEPVNDPRTSKELQDRLAEIKGHHTAPSPKMRKDRAAAMQELNDRKARDNGVLPLSENEDWTDEPSDITRDEPVEIPVHDGGVLPSVTRQYPDGDYPEIIRRYGKNKPLSSDSWGPTALKGIANAPASDTEDRLAAMDELDRRGESYPAKWRKEVEALWREEQKTAPTEPASESEYPGDTQVPADIAAILDKWVRLRGSGTITPQERAALKDAVEKHGEQAPRLYRGANMDSSLLTVGRPLDFGAASTSAEEGSALPYAETGDETPVLFNFMGSGLKGLNVQGRAEGVEGYGEAEWITGGRFYVRKVEERDGVLHVNLTATLPGDQQPQGDPLDMDNLSTPDEPAPAKSSIATITKTPKGYKIDFGEGRVANIGPGYTHVALYSTGGWNPDSGQSDETTFSKHKSLGGAQKAVRDHVAYAGGTAEIVDLSTVGGGMPDEPEPDPLRHKEQDFIDDAKARDASYDLVKRGVPQPGGPWKVSHGSRNGYIHVVNAQGIGLDVDRSELVEAVTDPLDRERDIRFQNAFKALGDATDSEGRAEELSKIFVMALKERAGRTRDVLPDAAYDALRNLMTASRTGLDEDGAAQNLRDALQNERVPVRWKSLADYLPGKEDPKQDKRLRESKAAHKAYRDALRAVDVSDGRVARKQIKSLLANLRGQTTEDLHLGVLTEDQTMMIDEALSRMWQSVGKPSRPEYDVDLIALRNAVRDLPDGNPWHDTAWTLHDLNQSAWRPTDIWNPPEPPRLNSILDEILDDKRPLGLTGVAIGMEDLWKMSKQEDEDYINKAVGSEKFWLTKGLQQAAVAMREGDDEAWESAMVGLLAQARGRNDHWGRAADRLAQIDALGKTLLRDAAGKVEQDLREQYGELPDERRTREAVIAEVGAFYSVRTSNSNCVLASQAYELRRRGIDAHPKQAKKGRNSTASQRAWFHTGYPFETYVDGLKGRRAKGRYETIVKHAMDNYEPGQRGTIRAGWKGRTFGHIWNWEILEDGSIVFLDAQTGEKIGPEREDYWGEMDWRFVTFARLDHLTLKSDIEVLIAPKENSEAMTPELLAVAMQLQELSRKRNALLHQLNNMKSMSVYDPGYPTWKTVRDSLYAQYTAVNGAFQSLRSSSEGERLTDIGRAFPFLEPDKYRK
jgi:hypothetical protein